MEKNDIPGSILTFILGLGVGALVGLLVAPKAVEELQLDLANGFADGVDQVRESGRDLIQRAKDSVATTQQDLRNAIEVGQAAYNESKNS